MYKNKQKKKNVAYRTTFPSLITRLCDQNKLAVFHNVMTTTKNSILQFRRLLVI